MRWAMTGVTVTWSMSPQATATARWERVPPADPAAMRYPHLHRRGACLPFGERRSGKLHWRVKAAQDALVRPRGGDQRCRFLRRTVQRPGDKRQAAVRGRPSVNAMVGPRLRQVGDLPGRSEHGQNIGPIAEEAVDDAIGWPNEFPEIPARVLRHNSTCLRKLV